MSPEKETKKPSAYKPPAMRDGRAAKRKADNDIFIGGQTNSKAELFAAAAPMGGGFYSSDKKLNSIGAAKSNNSKAELFAAAPIPQGTELQLLQNRQEQELYAKVDFLVSQVQFLTEENGALKEQMASTEEEFQAQLEEQEQRIKELENPRRSKRIAKLKKLPFYKNKKAKKT